MNTNYPGIDYSGPGATCNRKDGIRYGILSANCEHLTEWLWESVESQYTAYCPHCDNQLDDDWQSMGEESDDCPGCGGIIEDGEQWPEEPDCNILVDCEESGFIDDSNDIWVTDSPYFTHAQFCSPCAPGAGYLGNPCTDGPKTFCLGHDWFEGSAPYPVYSVATGKKVTE